MNVFLPPDIERYMQQKVSAGHYCSSSEMVQKALRLLKQKDLECEQRLATLRAEIQEGFDSGTSSPFSMKEIIGRAKSRKQAQDKP